MAKQQSVRRRIKRGNLRMIWNSTYNRMDFYRKLKDGKFVLCNPFYSRDLLSGPGVHSKTLDKWEAGAAA